MGELGLRGPLKVILSVADCSLPQWDVWLSLPFALPVLK